MVINSSRLGDEASECHSCGMPTVFMGPDDGLVATGGPAVEPEVLESLDEAERTRFGAAPRARQMGCTVGPGCGCLSLPVMAVAGALLLVVTLPLWLLSLGRVPVSLGFLGREAWRRRPGRGSGS